MGAARSGRLNQGLFVPALCAWLAATLLSCAPAQPGSPVDRADPGRPAQTLIVVGKQEPLQLAAVPLRPSRQAFHIDILMFNAGLTYQDAKNTYHPHLAEAIPQLGTDSWRVFPDGQMETTYRLRPNLTWHDGQPLSAEDFVFAWRVYADRGLGVFSPKPQDQIQAVTATDPGTIVIRWSSLYADADILGENLPALPRHILEQPFALYQQDPGTRDAFLKRPFWTTEYVGLGPYRLDRWEQGYALYAEAFSGYARGRPKIDRVIARIFSDENAVLTNMLSGEIQFATVYTLRFEHATVLKREWEPTNKGVVIFDPSAATNAVIQFRGEYQRTPGLLDLRVRRALNHAVDRQALHDGLFEGEGTIAYTPVSPNETYYAEVDRVITKYPYDLRRTDALMNEAGFFKDASGFYADAAGRPFRPDFQVLAGTTFERHQAIMADTWERAGIQTATSVMSTAQSRDLVNRSTFPGLGQRQSGSYTADQIGTPENGWSGSNIGGWSHSDYEGLYGLFNTTLERPERDRLQVQMAKFVSEQLPAFMLYRNFNQIAFVAALRGPRATNLWWSAHEWELR